MRYTVTNKDFVQLPETQGTVQNVSRINAVEVSDKQEENSGLLLPPLGKFSFNKQTLYARCSDGAGAEIIVMPFTVDGGSGNGNNYSATTDAEIEEMLDSIFSGSSVFLGGYSAATDADIERIIGGVFIS